MEAEQKAREAMMQLNLQDNVDIDAPQEDVRPEKKIARNDPCPCGSGKKYKQCCGKSGPKKGAFAS